MGGAVGGAGVVFGVGGAVGLGGLRERGGGDGGVVVWWRVGVRCEVVVLLLCIAWCACGVLGGCGKGKGDGDGVYMYTLLTTWR